VGEPPSFRWLPEECRKGLDDPYRLWKLCVMHRADVRVKKNAINIAKNDLFIE